MANYNEMTVEQLRQESRKRGMVLQEKGKKFTKSQLIERLMASDADTESDKLAEKTEENNKTEVKRVTYDRDIKPVVMDVIDKYTGSCSSSIVPGIVVAFAKFIVTKTGKEIYKIGTAKVVNTKRSSRLVKLEDIRGNVFIKDYDDVLYIRNECGEKYPKDIIDVFDLQTLERAQYLESIRTR